MFSIKKSIAALIATAGLFALTACTGSGNETAPSASTFSYVNAYPAAGDTIGVVGTGDELACDPSLTTVTTNVGTVDYNGFTIERASKGVGGAHGNMSNRTLLFQKGQPKIVSAIVRASDFYYNEKEDGTLEAIDSPQPDRSVNWSEELSGASSLAFDPLDFAAINGIDVIELCIDPTQTTEAPTPAPTN